MTETKNIKKKVAVKSDATIMDVLIRTLYCWPWVLLSLILCMGAATLYLLIKPNIYTTTASLLVKDESNDQNQPGMEQLSNVGLFKNKTNIQNELTTLSSVDLMTTVAKRLNLDINYYKEGIFNDKIVYGVDLPVKVVMPEIPLQSSVKFKLGVDDSGRVTLSDIVLGKDERLSEDFAGALNDTISTSFGPVIVKPASDGEWNQKVELLVDKIPMWQAVANSASFLMVTLENKDGTVINLTLQDESPRRGEDIINTLINVYNEAWIEDKNQIAISTSNFINDRLAIIETELGSVDSDISSYKSTNLIPDVDAAAAMYMSKSQQNEATMLEINNQLSMARYIRSYLTTDNNNDKLLPTNSGLANTDISSAIGEYNAKLLQRNSLVAKSSDINPLVQQLDEQLRQQRQAIIQTIDNEIISLNNQLKSVRGSEAQTIAKLASNPTQAKNLLSVERQQKVKESLYLFLLQKREENELTQAFTAYNSRIVRRPASFGPTSPKVSKVLTYSGIVGLAIPFLIIFLLENFNNKVRGRKDVEDLLPPFLGEIPLYGGNLKKGKSGRDNHEKLIVVEAGKRDIINEAFRVTRTNLEFMKINKDEADVIAVTSFNPGSGKSFLTMNLGVALALNNQKVIVVDGDMRHGSSSAYINSPDRGLSDILTGNTTNISEVIVTDANLPSLSVLPIGTVPPNPTELLKTQKFTDIITELRKEYDYILVDCPPIEVVADAQIIDKQADRTIFVLRAGLLERSMLPLVDKLYEEEKYSNMCILLNGTKSSRGRYGYSHSYRYGYGYGYGYGYNYGGRKASSKE